MNAKRISKPKIQNKRYRGKTNWSRLKALTEEDIVKGAETDSEARLLSKTELKKFRRVHSPRKINVKVIRRGLDLSQEEFARYFGVSKRTIQEWEQGRRSPTAIARNFLKVIECEPQAVQRALASSQHST